MERTTLFPLALEAMQALGTHYGDAMQQANAEAGLTQRDWNYLFLARSIHPAPITSTALLPVSPFVTAEFIEASLSDLTARGFLEELEGSEYSLSEQGRRASLSSIHAAHARLGELDLLPEPATQRLVALLRRIVMALVDAQEPAAKPHLTRSRSIDPGDSAPSATLIDQYLTDIALFRDDAHTAAWQGHDVDGPTWEALTIFWRGEADTFETLLKSLERRPNPPDTYRRAVDSLAARGWLVQNGDRYEVTDEGRALRDEAEETTDRLYYSPWNVLSDDELIELSALLGQLRDTATERADQQLI